MKDLRFDAGSARRSDGFTVAEVVMASAILLIVLTAILGGVQFATASTRMASMRQGAIDIATQQIEAARNLPYDSVGVFYSNGAQGSPGGAIPAVATTTTAGGTYTITTQVIWTLTGVGSAQTTAYKRIIVAVSWQDPTPGGSVSVETNIYGVGGGNYGTVKVTARDADDPSIKLPGIWVTLDPLSGSNLQNPTLGSPADYLGVAIFGNVPLGNCSLTATSSVYLCDVAALGTQPFNIHTGMNDLGFLSCQKGSNAVITAVGSKGQLLSGVTINLLDTTRNIPYTAVTGANGTCTFNMLWKSAYKVSYAGQTGTFPTFQITSGGQTVYQSLTVPDPSSITVTAKNSVTGAVIDDRNVTIGVIDVSTGLNLPSSPKTVSAGVATFQITKSGSYTIVVNSAAGYTDATQTISATFNTGDIPQDVMLTPRTFLTVSLIDTFGSKAIANVPVTVTNHATSAVVNTVGGISPGITSAAGTIVFPIIVTADYDVVATINKIAYSGSPSPVNVTAGLSSGVGYTISVTPGTLVVTASNVSGTASETVAVWDSNYVLQKTGTVKGSTKVVTFTDLFPGNYTVSVYGSSTSPAGAPFTGTIRSGSGTTGVRDTALPSGITAGNTTNLSVTAP